MSDGPIRLFSVRTFEAESVSTMECPRVDSLCASSVDPQKMHGNAKTSFQPSLDVRLFGKDDRNAQLKADEAVSLTSRLKDMVDQSR